MSNPACILVYGRDRSLLETRCLLLESTGGKVHSTTRLEDAKGILHKQCPDLMVLCYTLTTEDRAAILSSAEHSCPRIKTLVLTADGKPETGEGTHDIFTGARALKARVMQVLDQDRGRIRQQSY